MKHEQKFKEGVVIYRDPNAIEKMKLMGELGVSSKEERRKAYENASEFTLIAKTMECVHSFGLISKIDFKVEGKTISTWEEAIDQACFLEPLTQIATKTLVSVGVGASPEEETGESEGNDQAPTES